MDSLFSALFLATVFIVSIQVPAWIFTRAGLMQQQFDLFMLGTDSCRSGYQDHEVANLMFAPEAAVICPFRRGDFAAPGTTGHWPYAICSLIAAREHAPSEAGDKTCAYQ